MARGEAPGQQGSKLRVAWERATARRVLAGAAGFFGLGLVALAIMAGLGVNGTVTQRLKTIYCAAGTPGCAPRQTTHFHADFALFIDGKQFNFDQPQFVSTDGDLLAADAHIHPPRYTVVHVHYTNTTWRRFFQTLGFNLQDPTLTGVTAQTTCLTEPTGEKLCNNGKDTWKFFVNGVQVTGIAGTDIGDLDRVLISYGPESAAEVAATQLPKVTNQACIPDERCKSRIPPNEPPEECSISNSGGCAVTGG